MLTGCLSRPTQIPLHSPSPHLALLFPYSETAYSLSLKSQLNVSTNQQGIHISWPCMDVIYQATAISRIIYIINLCTILDVSPPTMLCVPTQLYKGYIMWKDPWCRRADCSSRQETLSVLWPLYSSAHFATRPTSAAHDRYQFLYPARRPTQNYYPTRIHRLPVSVGLRVTSL